MRSISNLLPGAGGLLSSLFAPAEDPRQVFVDARRRREDVLERVREARERLVGARERLAIGVGEARKKLTLLDERAGSARTESLARFTRQLRRMAGEELRGLEAQLDELREEEGLLPLIEQRILAELDALRSRDRVLDARHRTADARASVRIGGQRNGRRLEQPRCGAGAYGAPHRGDAGTRSGHRSTRWSRGSSRWRRAAIGWFGPTAG